MRIRRPGRRGLIAVLLALVVLLVAPAGLGATSAAFTASTSNPGNTFAADRLEPPSSLTVNQSCAGAAPPIAFRAASTASGVDTLTLPIPAGTVRNDVLVVQVASTNTTAAVTAPAGWTLARPKDVNTGYVAALLYWKVAGAAEPDPTFTFPAGTGGQLAGGIAAYSGVSTTNPVDTPAGALTNGNSPTAALSAFFTQTAGTLVVRMVAAVGPAYNPAPETTERWRRDGSVGTPGSPGVTAADQQISGTVVGKHSFTAPTGVSARFVGQWVALKRGPAPPSAVVSWTPTPSAWADGYRLERLDGTTPTLTQALARGTTSFTDPGLTSGSAYTYRLSATRGTWRSDPVTAPLTPSC